MVEHNPQQLDRIFGALADPTRRAMLRRLGDGRQCVSDLAEPFAMSLAGASKHLKVLENAGLVRRSIQGRSHWCELNAERLGEAHEWLGYYKRFWKHNLATLEALLRAEDEAGASPSAQEDQTK